MSHRRNQSAVWDFFKRTDNQNKLALCTVCEKELSYRSTTHNLKSHMKYLHPQQYDEILLKESGKSEVQVKREDEDANDSDHQSIDILSYFEQETGGRVRCALCHASRSNNLEELRDHLREKHPKLLGLPSQDAAASDVSINDEDGTYTEVIYLEEDVKKPTKYMYKKEHKPKRLTEHKKYKKLEMNRRMSSSSEELPRKKRKNENTSELDTFLTYIRCLLRQVPNDMCAKLQMDIVNLIMKAKLNRSNGSENVLETSTAMTKDSMDGSEAITVTEIPLSNASIDPVEHCYVDALSDKADH